MTAQVASLVGIATGLSVAVAILGQPAVAWSEAAEHSKQLWGTWVLGLVSLGMLAPTVTGVGWGSAAWLLACCGAAVAQPSLLADLREVRAHVRRSREEQEPVPPSTLSRADDLPLIRWRAPGA